MELYLLLVAHTALGQNVWVRPHAGCPGDQRLFYTGLERTCRRRLVMRCKVIITLGAAVLAMGAQPARAQTFPSYGCADGTKFIVGFYPYDKRAHIQLDGRAVTL